MTGNVVNKKPEIISGGMSKNVPWKKLTVVLAVLLLSAGAWIVYSSFMNKQTASTFSDVSISNPGKGDGPPSTVNGTVVSTPSPAENKKGQEKETEVANQFGKTVSTTSPPTEARNGKSNEIIDRFGKTVAQNDIIVIGDIPVEELKEPRQFTRKGVVDFVFKFSKELQDIKVKSNKEISSEDQFILRVKFYDKEGNLVKLENKFGSEDYIEIPILTREFGRGYTPKDGMGYVVKVDLIVYKIKNSPSSVTKTVVQNI